MAEAMVRSSSQAPHACVWRRVDATRTIDLVRGLNERWAAEGVKISPMTIAVAGLLDGARRFPGINSTFDAENNEIVVKRFVNMGVAVDTPRGLIVPNVKDADRLTLRELAQQIQSLVVEARSGTTSPSDLSGTTLTITNVGPFNVDGAMAILPPGTGAILAMGRVGRAPWVDGDVVVVRDVVELSLSFDHRMIDGALASQFLSFVGDFLNDPAPSLIDVTTL
jgi:pyruvate dehydrogenase E2 component (dihydrolipoamide acetyltransferase)